MSLDHPEVHRALASWLGARHTELLQGPDDGTRRDCLSALGWDETTLAAFGQARRLVVTLPHASPNVFFPRVGVSWYTRALQRSDPDAFHLRVVLTHVNFSDLGWRPYAWWFLDGEGELTRETLFTRNKKAKHVVVASQAPLGSVPERAVGRDRAAAELGMRGRDRAASYLLMTAAIERSAGLSVGGRSLYLPLPLLMRFFRDGGCAPSSDTARWALALLGASPGMRAVGADGKLKPTEHLADAFVMDNPTNIALLALLSNAGVVGGAKMAGYWDDILRVVENANSATGLRVAVPDLLRLPGEVDYERCVSPSPRLARALAEEGIGYSQGMALAEHGSFAEQANPFA